MKKIHLIMPMCGCGSRFAKEGFTLPKPLIQLQGKPFFYWATKSLSKLSNIMDITFIILQEHIDKFELDKKILNYFPDAKITVLPEVLNGAVLTCIEGLKNIDDDNPVIFNDCDHAFQTTEFEKFLNSNTDIDGGLLTFKSNENKFSYIKYDDKVKIIGTCEKVVVSNDAICGAYYFKSKSIFLKYAELYLTNCPYKEFFLSGVYNEMFKDKKNINCFKTDFHLSFGIPEEFEKIKKNTILKGLS